MRVREGGKDREKGCGRGFVCVRVMRNRCPSSVALESGKVSLGKFTCSGWDGERLCVCERERECVCVCVCVCV